MNRARKLRIDSLESDLNKLEKDYNDVADKRRCESNPQEINNLKLQEEHILKRIEDAEEQLEQLKQLEETKDNTEHLLQFLNSFGQEEKILASAQKAYHACSPEDWPNPVPDNLTGILSELKKIPQGSSKYTIIERWVGYLATNHELSQSVSGKLHQWGKKNIKGYSDLLKEVVNIQISINSYLMVVVHTSNQSSVSNSHQEEKYFVNGWFRQENDTALDCAPLSPPQYFPETVTADEIQELLKVFLKEIGIKYIWRQLTIELFLPLTLMNQAVDTWKIDDGLGFPIPIGCEYQVLVRSAERLLPTYRRYQGCWQEKWDFLQQLMHGSACNAFVSADGQDLRLLFFELSKKNIIGLKLVAAPPSIGKGSVFAVILKAATPVAIWLRESLSLNCQEQIDKLVVDCCIP
ncbi:MAG: hypothetical protein F6J86_42630, partial [Symploca sp. SIO1B1]|nr:hypothetical protein [Symploca sp. SIO1B1]